MSQLQLQKSHTNTNRQNNVVLDQLQVLRMTPWSTRGSTRKEAKEPNNLIKKLHKDRTVRLAIMDCPPEKGWTVWKTRRAQSALQKSPPTEKLHLCLNGPLGVADCSPAADCPPSMLGLPGNRHNRNLRTRKNTSPKSSLDLPNG
jgi:hypothetical protein